MIHRRIDAWTHERIQVGPLIHKRDRDAARAYSRPVIADGFPAVSAVDEGLNDPVINRVADTFIHDRVKAIA